MIIYYLQNQLNLTSNFERIIKKKKRISIFFSFPFVSSITKKYASEHQRSQTENICLLHRNDEMLSEKKNENDTFDDEISKLSFKEKMSLFNKNETIKLVPTSSLKCHRNRLTQVFYQ